jgi:hypothetical protein
MKAEKPPQGGFFAKKYRREYMYARLDRLRSELKKAVIKRDVAEEKVQQIEAKLKEEENRQIVCNVASYNLTPEQLAEFLKMVKDGKLQEMLNGNISMSADTGTNFQDTNKSMADNDTDKEYSSYNEEDFLDEEND